MGARSREAAENTATRVANALDEVATLMELANENKFKARAYERGAQAIRHLGEDLETRLKDKTLGEVENIGKSLVAAVEELVSSGKLTVLEELRARVPAPVRELAVIPGVGPKKAQQLYAELGIQSSGELEYAARENRLLHLKGFGAKTQSRILESVRALRGPVGAMRLDSADELLAPLLKALAVFPGVTLAAPVGEVGRRTEVCRRLDVLCAAADPQLVLDAVMAANVLSHAQVEENHVLAFETANGVPGALHVVSPSDAAAAAVFLTSTAEHLAALGQAPGGLTLTAQGARRSGAPVSMGDEAAVYAALGVPFIPVELRERAQDATAARAGKLPRLLTRADIKGMLHNHTTLSDGVDNARVLQHAATRMGLQYLGISDHSQSAFYARGLTVPVLLEQKEELRAASAEGGTQLWHGVESDILQDGTLDYPVEILAQLDFVIASIHGRFQNSPQQMTQRVLAAASNPWTDVIGHPTGRLLLSRDPAVYDLEAVLDAAARSGCAMELNAQPQRLDLNVDQLRWCKARGVKVCINADAHSAAELDALACGVSQARRAGLEPSDVINTLDATQLRAWLRARKAAAGSRSAP